ncbi:MAG: 50S ribosomal protein L25, partial [Actinomycetota bacterium]
QVDVPIVVVGESFAGTVANLDATSLAVEVEATHIPQHFEVSIEGLEEGQHITAADVKLPKGASLLADPETLIVAIYVPTAEAAAESTDEVAAEGEAAEAQAEEAAAE